MHRIRAKWGDEEFVSDVMIPVLDLLGGWGKQRREGEIQVQIFSGQGIQTILSIKSRSQPPPRGVSQPSPAPRHTQVQISRENSQRSQFLEGFPSHANVVLRISDGAGTAGSVVGLPDPKASQSRGFHDSLVQTEAKWKPYLIKFLPKSYWLGDGCRDLICQLLLFCNVLH